MHGILDRFETNDKAVILIEKLNKELIVSTDKLPAGSEKNTWFRLRESNGTYSILSIDEEKTSMEANKSADLMNRLRARKKSSKFKRK